MKISIVRILILFSCLFSTSATSGWGDDKYCHPFSESDCKKGDLIMTGGIKVLEYCDFEKNIITLNSRDGVDYIACFYIGEQRKNRKK